MKSEREKDKLMYNSEYLMFGKEITSRTSLRENDLPSPGGQPWAQTYIKLPPFAIHPTIGASYGLIWWMLEVGTSEGVSARLKLLGRKNTKIIFNKFSSNRVGKLLRGNGLPLETFLRSKIHICNSGRFALEAFLMNLIQSERWKCFILREILERQVFRSFGDGWEWWFMREMWRKRNEAQKAGWNLGFHEHESLQRVDRKPPNILFSIFNFYRHFAFILLDS